MPRYSNSYIDSFRRCPLQCRYKYDLHLQSREADDHHLRFGKAGHASLEVIYRDGDLEKAREAFKPLYPTQIDTSDLAKTPDNWMYTLGKYVENYGWDKQWKVIAVEAMDHTEDDYAVKLDLVVEDLHSGDLLGVDHKITGRYLNSDFWNDFNPNSQVTHYIRYIKEKYGRCDGFLINAIGMRYRQRAYKGEPAGFWCAFERQTFNRTPQQIAQEQESKAYWIDRIEDAKAKGVWGLNTSSCRFCSYRQLCAAGWDWENDSDLILTSFRQVCDRWIEAESAHCKLGLGHDGDHSGQPQAQESVEFVVEV